MVREAGRGGAGRGLRLRGGVLPARSRSRPCGGAASALQSGERGRGGLEAKAACVVPFVEPRREAKSHGMLSPSGFLVKSRLNKTFSASHKLVCKSSNKSRKSQNHTEL